MPNTMARNHPGCLQAKRCTPPAALSSLNSRAALRPAATSLSYRSLYFGSSLSGIFSPKIIFFQLISEIVFILLFDVFVQQGAPVHYQQPVRVVVRPGYPFQFAGGHQFTGENGSPPLDALAAIVGKLHFLLVEVDTVTEYREYRTRSHDIVVKSLFFQCIVLCQSGLVHQVHRLIHGVADIFVIRCQREKEMMDFLYIMI